jgi:hypothetical protein
MQKTTMKNAAAPALPSADVPFVVYCLPAETVKRDCQAIVVHVTFPSRSVPRKVSNWPHTATRDRAHATGVARVVPGDTMHRSSQTRLAASGVS